MPTYPQDLTPPPQHQYHQHQQSEEEEEDFNNNQDGEYDEPNKKKRISRACDNCNKRKVKCDGNYPSCGTCLRINIPCSYNRELRKRGPKGKFTEQGQKVRQQKKESAFSSPRNPSPIIAAPKSSTGRCEIPPLNLRIHKSVSKPVSPSHISPSTPYSTLTDAQTHSPNTNAQNVNDSQGYSTDNQRTMSTTPSSDNQTPTGKHLLPPTSSSFYHQNYYQHHPHQYYQSRNSCNYENTYTYDQANYLSSSINSYAPRRASATEVGTSTGHSQSGSYQNNPTYSNTQNVSQSEMRRHSADQYMHQSYQYPQFYSITAVPSQTGYSAPIRNNTASASNLANQPYSRYPITALSSASLQTIGGTNTTATITDSSPSPSSYTMYQSNMTNSGPLTIQPTQLSLSFIHHHVSVIFSQEIKEMHIFESSQESDLNSILIENHGFLTTIFKLQKQKPVPLTTYISNEEQQQFIFIKDLISEIQHIPFQSFSKVKTDLDAHRIDKILNLDLLKIYFEKVNPFLGNFIHSSSFYKDFQNTANNNINNNSSVPLHMIYAMAALASVFDTKARFESIAFYEYALESLDTADLGGTLFSSLALLAVYTLAMKKPKSSWLFTKMMFVIFQQAGKDQGPGSLFLGTPFVQTESIFFTFKILCATHGISMFIPILDFTRLEFKTEYLILPHLFKFIDLYEQSLHQRGYTDNRTFHDSLQSIHGFMKKCPHWLKNFGAGSFSYTCQLVSEIGCDSSLLPSPTQIMSTVESDLKPKESHWLVAFLHFMYHISIIYLHQPILYRYIESVFQAFYSQSKQMPYERKSATMSFESVLTSVVFKECLEAAATIAKLLDQILTSTSDLQFASPILIEMIYQSALIHLLHWYMSKTSQSSSFINEMHSPSSILDNTTFNIETLKTHIKALGMFAKTWHQAQYYENDLNELSKYLDPHFTIVHHDDQNSIKSSSTYQRQQDRRSTSNGSNEWSSSSKISIDKLIM